MSINTVRIGGPADPRLTDYVGLTDVARRSDVESAYGFFVAEGELVVRRALQAGYPLRSVLISEHRWAALRPLVEAVAAATGSAGQAAAPDVYVAPAPVLREVTGFNVHRGVLASFGRLPLPAVPGLLSSARRLVVLEGLNNTTNLGAVFRAAAGLGMDGALLDPRCCDPLYRRAVRVSMGEVFVLPYARLEPWPAALGQLHQAGFTVIGLTPAGAEDLDQVRPAAGERIAVLLGAEGPGLSASALECVDRRVRIPMSRGVDSLNVGAAAAVVFWALAGRCGGAG